MINPHLLVTKQLNALVQDGSLLGLTAAPPFIRAPAPLSLLWHLLPFTVPHPLSAPIFLPCHGNHCIWVFSHSFPFKITFVNYYCMCMWSVYVRACMRICTQHVCATQRTPFGGCFLSSTVGSGTPAHVKACRTTRFYLLSRHTWTLGLAYFT